MHLSHVLGSPLLLLVPKLLFGNLLRETPFRPRPKQEFRGRRSHTGVWEPGKEEIDRSGQETSGRLPVARIFAHRGPTICQPGKSAVEFSGKNVVVSFCGDHWASQ